MSVQIFKLGSDLLQCSTSFFRCWEVSAAGGALTSQTIKALPALKKMCPKCLCSVHVRKSKCSCGYFFSTKTRLIL